MGAKLLYFIVCESASIDHRTNKISLFNILESGSVDVTRELKDKPIIMPQFEMVACWQRDGEFPEHGYQQRVEFIGPDGEKLWEFGPVSFDLTAKRHRQFMSITGLPITEHKSGEYIFRLYLKDPSGQEKSFGDYPYTINFELVVAEESMKNEA